LDEITCGNFIGHYSVAREQKAWFFAGARSLSAQAGGAFGASA
jgi:hypothetical protein